MLVSNTMVIYHGILTLEKVGNAVNYHGIFIILAKNTMVYHSKLSQYFYNFGPWWQGYNNFLSVIYKFL
jgi:hypothetical protein